MAYNLDGVNQYLDCAMPAALKSAPGGPLTMVALLKLDSATDGGIIVNMTGTTVVQFMEVFTGFNYGTSAGTRNGPAASGYVGTWTIVVISKNTGNVAPEYSILTDSGSGFAVVASGTITGGGATLGDGTAPGASGFIRIGRWGTSGSEYVDGAVGAVAQYTAFMDATARALLVNWNAWLAASGLAHAMEFTALTSRTDASGNGGDETGRFGTDSITLVSDPANFFPSGGSAVDVADVPTGVRLRSGSEAVLTGLAVADSPRGLRLRSPEGSGAVSGVQATTDAPAGLRLRSGDETTAVSGGAVVVPDGSPDGIRLRAVGGAAVLGHSITMLPEGWRVRSAPESVSAGVVVVDAPGVLRLRSGASSVDVGAASPVDTPSGLRWRSAYEVVSGATTLTPEATITAEVTRVRVKTSVLTVRITSAVRRFRT